MHRLTVLYPHPDSVEHFIAHYQNVHTPLVVKLPGLRSSVASWAVEGIGGGPSPYFAVWQGDFASADELAAALESPEGQAVVDDLPNFAPQETQVFHFAVS